ncbi:MAG: hypothetical protein JWR07_4423 [Nevskia sp.]|nr:hypothetical protein [Nevskia sp.]
MKARDTAFWSATLLALLYAVAASAAETADKGGPARIPFTLTHSNIVVEVGLMSDHPLPFIFDSGLSVGNILTTDTARKLGLSSKGRAHFTDSSGTGGSTGVTTIQTVHVGAAVLDEQTFAITDVPETLIAQKGKPPIAGFLGAPLMQEAVLCIDYRHKVMQRWKRSDFDDAGLSSIPMRSNHGLPTIDISIDGLQATLIVDSGNNGGVELFPAFAEQNDLRKRYPDLKLLEGTAGGGQTFDVFSGVADAVGVDSNSTLRQVPLSLIAQAMDPAWGIDGLAGFEFLSRLNPCLDREGQRLLWAAKKTARHQ